MPFAPKRRWFQWSLAMLIVLTVFGCWLGWQVKTVRDRSNARYEIEARGAKIAAGSVLGGSARVVRAGDPLAKLPWIRRALGDEPVGLILFPGELSPSDLEKADYFPEACVLRNSTYIPVTTP